MESNELEYQSLGCREMRVILNGQRQENGQSRKGARTTNPELRGIAKKSRAELIKLAQRKNLRLMWSYHQHSADTVGNRNFQYMTPQGTSYRRSDQFWRYTSQACIEYKTKISPSKSKNQLRSRYKWY